MNKLLSGLVVSVVLNFVITSSAAVLYVDLASPNPTPPYSSWATAATSIQDAVDASADGDEVLVADGHYLLSYEITVTKRITIQSVHGPETVIVDGRGYRRGFNLNDSLCVISGLTITNGYTVQSVIREGGGIYCTGYNPVITNCVVIDNEAGGGGVYKGTLIDCIIEGNYSGYKQHGGGVLNSRAERCLIQDNGASHGGGISGGEAINCWIMNNRANGSILLTGTGGGANNAVVRNSFVSGNSASTSGGGIAGGSVYNCTIVDNAADSSAGMAGGTAYNSIIYHNNSSTPSSVSSSRYNCCSLDVVSGVNGSITNDPQIISLYKIADSSPCIGAGSTNYLSGVDLDGESWSEPPSIGCDEYSLSAVGDISIHISGPTNLVEDLTAEYGISVSGMVGRVEVEIDGIPFATNITSFYQGWENPGTHTIQVTAFNDTHSVTGVSETISVNVNALYDGAVYVSPAGLDSNDGLSWQTAKATIQAGIDATEEYLALIVSNGTYSITTPLSLDKDIYMTSVNGPESTVIDAGGVTRCMGIYSDYPVVNGFTFTGGDYYSAGGGVYCSSINPTIENCIIENCVVNSSFSAHGGGICGGTVVNSIIRNNAVEMEGDGGGAYLSEIIQSVVVSNKANAGGGVSFSTVYNSLITENRAFKSGVVSGRGGGAYNSTLYNCNVVGNTASYRGGGLYGSAAYNTIIYYNDLTDEADDLWSSTLSYSCAADATHGVDGNIADLPGLVSPFRLATNSPCISAGDPIYSVDEDIDGDMWRNPPSMGCDEPTKPFLGDLDIDFEGPSTVVISNAQSYRVRVDGESVKTTVDLGDGAVDENVIWVEHMWDAEGIYDVTVTAFSDSYPLGVSVRKPVRVVGPDAVVYVSVDGDDANDGWSWDSAKASIQAGIDTQIISGGKVFVSNGTYYVDSEITILYEQYVEIESIAGPYETVIQGNGNCRIIGSYAPEGLISGFTITNGNVIGYGGGIYCNYRDDMVIANCIISGNQATTYNGGGVRGGNCINCVIKGNYTSSDGGGIHWGNATDCLIIGNQAGGRYGGIYGSAYNCTIVSNEASQYGGFGWKACNSIVYYNTPEGGTYDLQYSCSPVATHGMYGNTTNAPVFVDTVAGDYRLMSNSPCINRGRNSYASGVIDFAGDPRIVYGVVDMGAYEFAGPVSGTPDFDGDGMSDIWEGDHFGSTAEEPDGNVDGDSSDNGGEYIAGTDSSDPSSFFHVTSETSSSGNPSQQIIIEWQSVSGRVYNVLWTPSLLEPFEPLEIGIQSPQNSYTAVVDSVESAGFYRVVVMLAEYDADGDGLPNDWETEYGVTDASADGDNDGFSSLAEFISGTDPTNGASYFSVMDSAADVNGTNCFVVEWISVPDRLYSVQWSTNLLTGFETIEPGYEHPVNSYTDTVRQVESEVFYKVDVQLK